jgi:hypothetical protein
MRIPEYLRISRKCIETIVYGDVAIPPMVCLAKTRPVNSTETYVFVSQLDEHLHGHYAHGERQPPFWPA